MVAMASFTSEAALSGMVSPSTAWPFTVRLAMPLDLPSGFWMVMLKSLSRNLRVTFSSGHAVGTKGSIWSPS